MISSNIKAMLNQPSSSRNHRLIQDQSPTTILDPNEENYALKQESKQKQRVHIPKIALENL